MISVSTLLCDHAADGNQLRYNVDTGTDNPVSEEPQRRPVVVWNTTNRCNLKCVHCYAGAETEAKAGELTTTEGKRLLDDLADYGAPVVLFSGGEPMVREDLTELVAYAADAGIRPVLSTNGTLLTEERARELKEAGLAYAGVSVDGLAERNDEFRGVDGAFQAAVEGIESCLDVGLKTGLRYTVTGQNVDDLDGVVDLLTDVGLDRFCFYHLSYSGRGETLSDIDLDAAERREVVKRICDRTLRSHRNGDEIETLLVGNYADAAYIVEYARREFGDEAAERVYKRLEQNGGDPTGERVAAVDCLGNVHPTQFWRTYSLGNVRDRPFSDIWEDESNPLLRAVRNRPENLTGKCADCQYKEICRGGSRLRALASGNGLFGPDPQCYLDEAERQGTRPPASAD
ncbi:Fe-coproporphyrin synthase AhbC [Natronomonas pharaonis DSM 2160]|uniref:Fe-coproporphyrin synthase AhbC n=1 Tax=Natronomonas pharaonis (strain ATCC 35678 / DSM 2160 / CIP 103997 / JCM 8858 / NBRC 14720 / NCIMB 2260 / Gabara) TaxID=348780 RepID=A0A1U7EV23_NATPD|nr:TIGR04347 family pseudo-SAM/SPASM protein [Natronomonas pharaonis]CAI48862.1 Fe-coproporphyrin synthase AhbC [Natronomonas pharaonis DSM 2160]